MNFDIDCFLNDRFDKDILENVKSAKSKVSDTGELYLRSLRLSTVNDKVMKSHSKVHSSPTAAPSSAIKVGRLAIS